MENSFEREIINKVIKFIVIMLKWIALVLTIAMGGLTLGFFIISLLKNVGLSNSIVARMTSYITLKSESVVLDLINSKGVFNVTCSTLIYGFSNAVTYGLIYYILDKYIIVFNNITNEKIYNKNNMYTIKKCVYIGMIVALLNPFLLTIEYFLFNIIGTESISFNGLIYFVICYTLYILFKKGYELENTVSKLKRDLKKIEYNEENKKIQKIKNRTKKNKDEEK